MSLDKNGDFSQKELAIAGFKAVDKILSLWGCSTMQSQNILKVSKSNYHKFKCHPETTKLSDDQLERVSHLLNIHQSLHVLFSNPANVNGFMSLKNNNDFFAGRTPIEIISSGRFGDLYEVSRRISVLTNGI